MSHDSKQSQRVLPVRKGGEPFRSRRITSRSFEKGFRATMKVDGKLLRGHVIDVSTHGASIQLAQDGGILADDLLGQSVEELSLDFFGEELFRGPGEVRYCRDTGNGLKLGLRLSSQAVDFSTLHRTSYQLQLNMRWQQTIVVLEKEQPASDSFPDWVDACRRQLAAIKNFVDTEEAAVAKDDYVTRNEKLTDLLSQSRDAIVDRLHQCRRELNQFADRCAESEREAQRQLFRDQLSSLLTLCPFTDRALRKPLGYAGDYELMSMLYRAEPEGESVFAKVLNIHSKEEPAGKATINRLEYLGHQIESTIQRSVASRVRIASIGSGAAREVIYLLERKPELGARIDLTLLDQDEHAMENCERTLIPLAIKTGAMFEFVGDPIQQLLQSEDLSPCLGERELIYSAGLFDYLEDDLFSRLVSGLYEALTPGGRMVIGNMASHNPTGIGWNTRWTGTCFIGHVKS